MALVQVSVPEEHVLAVYALISELSGSSSPPVGTPAKLAAKAPDATADVVQRMYVESFERHRELLRLLADRQDEWVSSGSIIDALKLENGRKSLAGMFGAFGRRSKHRYGGAKPWRDRWDPESGETGEQFYLMPQEVAEWVREAAASEG